MILIFSSWYLCFRSTKVCNLYMVKLRTCMCSVQIFLLLLTVFNYIWIQRLGRKLYWARLCFLFRHKTCIRKYFLRQKYLATCARYARKHIRLLVKDPLLWSNFQNCWYVNIFYYVTNGIFHECLFSCSRVLTCRHINGQTASQIWRCIFLFPYWGETPAVLRPLLSPLSVSWMVEESV